MKRNATTEASTYSPMTRAPATAMVTSKSMLKALARKPWKARIEVGTPAMTAVAKG